MNALLKITALLLAVATSVSGQAVSLGPDEAAALQECCDEGCEDACDLITPSAAPTQSPDPATDSPTGTSAPDPQPAGLCFRPDGCTERTCQFQCDLPLGYYPDPTNCQAYCFCTGGPQPSRYEVVQPTLVWDATCQGAHAPLDPNNNPLGGTEGGCANFPASVNLDHCVNPLDDRRLKGRQQKAKKNEALRVLQQGSNSDVVNTNCCRGDSYAGGDPHFKRWNGEYFDFHGQCDLILLSAPGFGHGLGLQLHVRTQLSRNKDFSYINVAALRIGETILEVSSWGDFMINDVESPDDVTHLEGIFAFTHIPKDKKHHVFEVDLGDGQTIQFKTLKQWVSVNLLSVNARDFKSSVGLMGNFWTGAKLDRAGTAAVEDNTAFGEEWRVTAEDPQLLAQPVPHYPQVCVMPIDPQNKVASS